MPRRKVSKQTTLFDIRIRSCENDVILLKGSHEDAASALLSGVIVLSVLEPMPIKKLSLRLVATLRFRWKETYATASGHATKENKYKKIVFEFCWDDLNISEYFKDLYDIYMHKDKSYSDNVPTGTSGSAVSLTGLTTGRISKSNNSSSSSLKSLSNTVRAKSKSSTSLQTLANLSSTKTESHTLGQGNYEIPFSTVLPGDIPESLEGAPGASLIYELEANLERSRFVSNIVAKKHLRVIRTMNSDAAELTETVAVDNTWPNKVDYCVSIPNRAMAIGSVNPLEIILVPLSKGLRLGNISLTVIEQYNYKTAAGSQSGERIVSEKYMKKPSKTAEGKSIWQLEPDINGVFFQNEELMFSTEKWEIRTTLPLENSLDKCSPDSDIAGSVKIRHKLKFNIGLLNSDGHISELRGTLPVILFISPFVPVIAAKIGDPSFEGKNNRPSAPAHSRSESDTVLFRPRGESGANTPLQENPPVKTNTIDLMAPPNYESHVFDIPVDNYGTPLASPGTSGTTSPRLINPGANGNSTTPSTQAHSRASSYFALNISPNSSSINASDQLARQLRALNTRRGSQESEPNNAESKPSRNKPIFTLSDEEDDDDETRDARDSLVFGSQGSVPHINQLDSLEFSTGTLRVPRSPILDFATPGILSPIQHLSRANSKDNISTTFDWDDNVLSRVPSYETAVKNESMDEPTPVYVPPSSSSGINMEQLNRRLKIAQSSQDRNSIDSNQSSSRSYSALRLPLRSPTLESHTSIMELAKSRGSSNGNSPAVSRNQSSLNLTKRHMGANDKLNWNSNPLDEESDTSPSPQLKINLPPSAYIAHSSSSNPSGLATQSETPSRPISRPSLGTRTSSFLHLGRSFSHASLSNHSDPSSSTASLSLLSKKDKKASKK
ncbi:BA75_03576T0 [Komagataella pastoris]|uniref:BA75_03576T0 n=1 Tax=Komagataella pastoris TaxID=4922 RepID=A0A1B2JF67_PICPA|nr:BA75_03576T0 [Komagataella pastoris]